MPEEYKELFNTWFSEQTAEGSFISSTWENTKVLAINSFNQSVDFVSTHQNVIIALVVGFVIGMIYSKNKK